MNLWVYAPSPSVRGMFLFVKAIDNCTGCVNKGEYGFPCTFLKPVPAVISPAYHESYIARPHVPVTHASPLHMVKYPLMLGLWFNSWNELLMMFFVARNITASKQCYMSYYCLLTYWRFREGNVCVNSYNVFNPCLQRLTRPLFTCHFWHIALEKLSPVRYSEFLDVSRKR